MRAAMYLKAALAFDGRRSHLTQWWEFGSKWGVPLRQHQNVVRERLCCVSTLWPYVAVQM